MTSMYEKSYPYLEAVEKISPDEPLILQALKEYYVRTNNNDKAAEYKQKLESATGGSYKFKILVRSVLETNRLLIKPTSLEDAEFVLELMNTDGWIRFIGDRNVHTIEDAKNYISEKMLPQLEEYGFGNNTLIRKSDKLKIGSCGMYLRPGMEGADIGFALLPKFYGQGYAYEASKALLDYSVETLKLPLIQAITTKENVDSQTLITKLGMKFIEVRDISGISEPMLVYRYGESQ